MTLSIRLVTRVSGSMAGEEEDDPQLAEFLEVMKPRRKTSIWANDEAVPLNKGKPALQAKLPQRRAAADSGDSGDEADELYQDLPRKAPAASGEPASEIGAHLSHKPTCARSAVATAFECFITLWLENYLVSRLLA
jgi:hypothetical protein